MADTNTQSKIDAAAEKAYADASATKVDLKEVVEAVKADAPKPQPKAEAVREAVKAPAKTAAKKTASKKTPAKKAAIRKSPAKAAAKPAAKKTAARKSPARAASAPATFTNSVTKFKDTIMAKAQNTDFSKSAQEMAANAQERAKAAYATAGVFAGEFGEFNKANLEAVVESGKIFFAGAQEMARENVETSKSLVETVTSDAQKVAAVKSPTELFQLQGELARRNFDAIVGYGSKRTEAWVKLYNEAFAPISNRVSVAAEKVSKAA
jgi:phasin family protein